MYFTQVPQLELRFLGTGMVIAWIPLDLHNLTNLIDPKCMKNVAIYVVIAITPVLLSLQAIVSYIPAKNSRQQ
jgi:hypothetical protein